ncbi:hypothetical protein [Nocardioides sp. YIM 152588]|uniref:hypothetical protein n=1 Tax=Nocardioides sp. YIM 152588 TaxID=3158259 RepID=UPI0032E4AF4B
MSAAAPKAPESWEEALQRLEAHVDRAEGIISGLAAPDEDHTHEPWVEPTGLGPMPTEFLFRAKELLERQQRLMATLPALLADNQSQRAVAAKVSDATAVKSGPVYLDVTA